MRHRLVVPWSSCDLPGGHILTFSHCSSWLLVEKTVLQSTLHFGCKLNHQTAEPALLSSWQQGPVWRKKKCIHVTNRWGISQSITLKWNKLEMPGWEQGRSKPRRWPAGRRRIFSMAQSCYLLWVTTAPKLLIWSVTTAVKATNSSGINCSAMREWGQTNHIYMWLGMSSNPCLGSTQGGSWSNQGVMLGAHCVTVFSVFSPKQHGREVFHSASNTKMWLFLHSIFSVRTRFAEQSSPS